MLVMQTAKTSPRFRVMLAIDDANHTRHLCQVCFTVDTRLTVTLQYSVNIGQVKALRRPASKAAGAAKNDNIVDCPEGYEHQCLLLNYKK